MRISDWSSDVCSSDLQHGDAAVAGHEGDPQLAAAAWHPPAHVMGPEAVVVAVAIPRRQAAVGGVALPGGVSLALVPDRLRLAAGGAEATYSGHVVARPHPPPHGICMDHRAAGPAGPRDGAATAHPRPEV